MKFLHRQVRRVAHPMRGLYYALQHDAVQVQLLFGLLIALITYITRPFDELALAVLIIAYMLLCVTELLNTALEAALDKLHPEHDENIGRSKDIAASAVLVAGTFTLLALIWLGLS